MEKQNLRAYFFQNMYLHGLHAGIQSQHTTAEMFIKYCEDCRPYEYLRQEDILCEWAREHKTTIVLNGGMSGDLEAIKDLLDQPENPYPWSFFKETEYALNGALTNVGIILPERIFNVPFVTKDYDSDEVFEQYRFENELSEWEIELIRILKSKRLMN